MAGTIEMGFSIREPETTSALPESKIRRMA